MKLYPKIDVYAVIRNARGQRIGMRYLCSTNRYRLCREARESVRKAYELGHAELDARFDKGARA